VNRAILEKTGYKLFTFGNNELLTFTKEQLRELFDGSSVTVVSSNVADLETKQAPEWVRTSRTVSLGGVRVTFLGVTIPYPLVYELMGWRVREPVEAIREELARVREEADVTVLLSHLGFHNDRALAKELSGVDVIIGSHTHHLLETPERIGDTWIAAAGKFGQYLGHLILEVDAETGALVNVDGACHPLDGEEGDDGMNRLLGRYRKVAAKQLAMPAAYLDEPLPVDWRKETPLPNLLADSLREWVGADAALVNNGVLLHSLNAGPVTRGELHRACPHPINPALVRIRGREIRKTLEESLLQEFVDMPIRGFGFRGRVLGTVAVSGMEVRYVPDAPAYRKIREIRLGERILRDDDEISLATIDMFTFGVGYLGLKEGRLIRYCLPEFLRDLLADRLRKPGAAEAARQSRWKPV
jgi:5'-nucleotidase